MSSEVPNRKKADQGPQASTSSCDGNTAVCGLVPSGDYTKTPTFCTEPCTVLHSRQAPDSTPALGKGMRKTARRVAPDQTGKGGEA
jgi:hypothetical protein